MKINEYLGNYLKKWKRWVKPTGSLYLHCDQTASHYLKLVLDAIFNGKNFRREIIWSNEDKSGFKSKAKNWIRGHDVIFYYLKSFGSQTFNKQYLPLDLTTIKRYDKTDENNLHYKIYREKDGRERRSYLKIDRGASMSTVWSDIPSFQTVNNTGEYLGYPTQKPVALLERILKASSNEGDVVLDPFCGCGTTIDAARKLKRNWIGIDISSFAIDLIIEKRLMDKKTPIEGIPCDLASAKKLARENAFDFESWAVSRIPGFVPNTKQVADGGVDGRAKLADMPDDFNSQLALAQVKGGKFNLSSLRDFSHVNLRDRAAVGCFLTLEPITSTDAKREAANVGKISVRGYEYRRMQLWPISEYFEGRLPDMPIMSDPYTGHRLNQPSLF